MTIFVFLFVNNESLQARVRDEGEMRSQSCISIGLGIEKDVLTNIKTFYIFFFKEKKIHTLCIITCL